MENPLKLRETLITANPLGFLWSTASAISGFQSLIQVFKIAWLLAVAFLFQMDGYFALNPLPFPKTTAQTFSSTDGTMRPNCCEISSEYIGTTPFISLLIDAVAGDELPQPPPGERDCQ